MQFVLSLVVHLTVLMCSCYSFNVSPQPNFVFKPPHTTGTRSPYFGFSVTLRETSLMVGAPRAHSNSPHQVNISSPGAVYRCPFDTEICAQFVLDQNGNVLEETGPKTGIYKTQVKDNQFLGGAMDGSGPDDMPFVACGHLFKAVSQSVYTDYYTHGVCYVALSSNVSHIVKINPYNARHLKDDPPSCPINAQFAQMGFSVHITPTREILMGAPGVCLNKGSLVWSKPTESGYKNDVITAKVLKSDTFTVPVDSYFGFAITSDYFYGPHNATLVYVATGPQADQSAGAVYLFTFITAFGKLRKRIHRKLSGQSMGEYFGHAVVAEDFDADGWPDLAISAPMHSKTLDFENGRVFVLQNKGKLNFDEQVVLTSSYGGSGHFGQALGKIGDINRDQYNDLAVGAPFEENGAVYIFLGGPGGLSSTPSQKLVSPRPFSKDYGSFMFGHAISQGVDIDANTFPDIAVGSPHSDTVFVYKTYPSVRVKAKVYPSKVEINEKETVFNLTFTWRYEKLQNFDEKFDFAIRLEVDPKLKRALFDNGASTRNLKKVLTRREQSDTLQLRVFYQEKHLMKPIHIEMHYDVVHKVPENSTKFCRTCVALTPHDRKLVRTRIVFKTECTEVKCLADLSVGSTFYGVTHRPHFVVGSADRLTVEYTINNTAQTAYLPQIKVEFPAYVMISRKSENCTLDTSTLLCDLGFSLQKDMSVSLNVTFNIEKLEGSELVINATAITASDELNEKDNVLVDVIPLRRHSVLGIIGSSVPQQLFLDGEIEDQRVVQRFEIHNYGPSAIDEIDVRLFLPLVYQKSSTGSPVTLYNFTTINVTASYKLDNAVISWTQNGADLYKLFGGDSEGPAALLKFNENILAQSLMTPNFDGSPQTRTTMLNCSAAHPHHGCIEGSFNVRNVQPNGPAVEVVLEFWFEIETIKKLFKNEQDIFIFQTSAIVHIPDENATHSDLYRPASTELHRHSLETPWWIYVLSLLIGLLILMLITGLFKRLGFFKREKKEEMDTYFNSDLEKIEPLALKDFAFRDDYLNLEL